MAASISIPVYYQDTGNFVQSMSGALLEAMKGNLKAAGGGVLPGIPFREMKSPYFDSLLKASRETAENFDFEQLLAERWMQKTSVYGFNAAPTRNKIQKVTAQAKIQVDPLFPLIWKKFGNEILVCCVGNRMTFPAVPWLEQLFEELNRGKVETFESLQADWAKRVGADPKTIAKVLSVLSELQAFDVIS
jgi:hypothetical protein